MKFLANITIYSAYESFTLYIIIFTFSLFFYLFRAVFLTLTEIRINRAVLLKILMPKSKAQVRYNTIWKNYGH